MAETLLRFFSQLVVLNFKNTRHLFLAGIFLVFYSQVAIAGAWLFDPTLGVSQIYTDNIELTDDVNKEKERITQITPGFNLSNNSRKTSVDVSYGVAVSRYAEDKNRDEVNQQLDAGFRSEIVAKEFIVESNLTHSQTVFDARDQLVLDTFTTLENKTDITTFNIKPILLKKVGKYNNKYQYTFSRVVYGNARFLVQNNNAQSIEVNVDSGNTYSKALWETNYRRTDLSVTEGTFDSNTEIIDTNLKYQVFNRLRFTAGLGYEDNNLGADESITDSGSFWSLGFTWSPNSRNVIEASIGDRFFGKTKSLHIENRHKTMSFSLSYTEEVTNSSQLIERRSDGDSPIGILNNDFLNEKALIRYTWHSRRFTFSLDGFNERRSYDFASVKEKTVGYSTSLGWRAGRRTSFALDNRVQKIKYIDLDEVDKIRVSNISYVYNINGKMVIKVSYKYAESISDLAENSYEQRVAQISLNAVF